MKSYNKPIMDLSFFDTKDNINAVTILSSISQDRDSTATKYGFAKIDIGKLRS